LPRGAVGKQCASHELNYTLIERKSKNFLREISEATVLPHNAEIVRLDAAGGQSERMES
jgi:hypothetical protein